MYDNKISIVHLSKQMMVLSQIMNNGNNLKSCTKLFCVVLLFKACVIATTVYVLLTFHFDRNVGGLFNQPVARRLQNWTQIYLGNKLAALTNTNTAPNPTGRGNYLPTGLEMSISFLSGTTRKKAKNSLDLGVFRARDFWCCSPML